MPYISPSLSPTKCFSASSTTSSGASSPLQRQDSSFGSSNGNEEDNDITYSDGYPCTSSYGGGATSNSSSSQTPAAATVAALKRPHHHLHRHHSRSHSSDTLVTLNSSRNSSHASSNGYHHHHQPSTSSSSLSASNLGKGGDLTATSAEQQQQQQQQQQNDIPHPPTLYNRHSRSSKMTPDYIFVQPASPGPNEEPNTNNNGYYHSLPSSSSRSYSYSANNSTTTSPVHASTSYSSSSSSSQRPSLRRLNHSRQSASSVFSNGDSSYYGGGNSMTSPPSSTAGDFGDVAPPRSSSSGSLSSSSSSAAAAARRARRGISASADSSPRHSISFTPLPRISSDDGGNSSRSQSPSLYDHEAQSQSSPAPVTPVNTSFPQSTSASFPTSSSSSSSLQPQSQSMQFSLSDSALPMTSSPLSSTSNTPSTNSAESSQVNSDDESSSPERILARNALSSPLLQKHKPSWGEIPSPASLSNSTAFSFGQQQRSNTSTPSTSTTTTPSPSSSSSLQLTTKEINRANANGMNEEMESETPTPKAEKTGEDIMALPLHATATEPAPSSSIAAQPSTNGGQKTMTSFAVPVCDGSDDITGSDSTTTSSSDAGNTTTKPKITSGPLAPAATSVKRRPHHVKAFSERAESPFRLEFESNNTRDHSHPSTHSRMTGLRQREASVDGAANTGNNASASSNAAASSSSSSTATATMTTTIPPAHGHGHSQTAPSSASQPHFAHGGLAVHTHHPLYHLQLQGGGGMGGSSASSSMMGSATVGYGGRHGTRSASHRGTPLPTPMLRKKSGELVKSSMKHDSRAKSAPTTPTGPKAVHFDQQLERVKLFLAQQKPTAVSRDGSPVDTETEDDSEANAFPFPPMTTSIPAQITLVLPEFPKNMLPDLGNRDVCLETLEIAADSKSLKGTALLRNLAFEKRLSIRFTFDDWQTVSEVTGEWQATLNGGNIDRWSFRIKLDDMLARIEDKKLYLALKYTVAGRDIWDSNNGNNYKAEFKKQAARSQAVVGGSRAARHEWAVTNAGQANERMADLRRELDRLVAGHEDDDFSSADELIISNAKNGNGLKFQHRFLGGEAVPLAQAPASNTFSSRYDFGASLKKAATTTAGIGAGGGNNANNTGNAANVPPVAANSSAAAANAQPNHRNSPQSAHAILDNPYFAAPNVTDAMITSWRNAAHLHAPISSHPLAPASSPMPAPPMDVLSPQSQQHQRLYADDDMHHHQPKPALMTTAVIGGMPATTFVPAEPSATSTPPASFSGTDYYHRTEANGVISQDFGLPNLMSYMNIGMPATSLDSASSTGTGSAASSPRTEVPSSADSVASSTSNSTAIPGSYFPAGDPISSTSTSATSSTNPSVQHSPTTDFSGGAPLSRANRFHSFPPVRSFLTDVENATPSLSQNSFRIPGIQGAAGEPKSVSSAGNKSGAGGMKNGLSGSMFRQHSGNSLSEMNMLDDSLLLDSSIDPRDASHYSMAALSPRSTSPPITSSAEIPGVHQRRHSPPPRPISPDDLLSPSPSSASTDTSISTPQSPGGSPPLRMYSPFIASANSGGGRPEMGSDTYFNFVHRYCWGNGEPTSSSAVPSSSSTSAALGLAGLNPSYDIPTPRRITPSSSCSASLLSSPTQSQSGSRTPSPKNGSPSLESVQRMDAKGYMSGLQTVHI